jgi:hypothetical protein
VLGGLLGPVAGDVLAECKPHLASERTFAGCGERAQLAHDLCGRRRVNLFEYLAIWHAPE